MFIVDLQKYFHTLTPTLQFIQKETNFAEYVMFAGFMISLGG